MLLSLLTDNYYLCRLRAKVAGNGIKAAPHNKNRQFEAEMR